MSIRLLSNRWRFVSSKNFALNKSPAHHSIEELPASPFDENANWLSWASMWYVWRLVFLGYKRPLESTDIWAQSARDGPEASGDAFWASYTSRLQRTNKRGTIRALFSAFRGEVALAGVLYFLAMALRFAGPFILSILVTFITTTQENLEVSSSNSTTTSSPTRAASISVGAAYGYAVLMFVCQILQTWCTVTSDQMSMRTGIKMRNALTMCTFRHSLALTGASTASSHAASGSKKTQVSAGTVTNLATNDAATLVEFMRFFHQSWTAPLVLIAGIVYMNVLVGVSAVAGLAVLLLFLPVSMSMAKRQTQITRKMLHETDLRLKASGEALNGIRAVKLNAWERALETLIRAIRAREVVLLYKLEALRAIITPLSVATPNIASVVCFVTYVSIGNVLDPSSAFATISLWIIVRQPFVTFPLAIAQFSRLSAMGTRFDAFFALETRRGEETSLLLDEPRSEDTKILPGEEPSSAILLKPMEPDAMIQVTNATFSWRPLGASEESTEDEGFRLSNVSFTVRRGELVVLFGRVGSGKSTLLQALIGELPPSGVSGSVRTQSLAKLAYAPQEPFISNATVRANVLFYRPMESEAYEAALTCTSLSRDVQEFPGRDECEIGERGVNLSGGQKARVALARAVYSGADVYLLDDPLSAVDAHVGRHILDACICGALREKTRILVTNSAAALKRADRVIALLPDGKGVLVSTYEELVASGRIHDIGVTVKEEEEEEEAETSLGGESAPTTVSGAPGSLHPQRSEPNLLMPAVIPLNLPDTIEEDEVPNEEETGEVEEDAQETSTKSPQDAVPNTLPVVGASLNTSMVNINASSKLTQVETRRRGADPRVVYTTYGLSGARGSYVALFLLIFAFVVTEGLFLSVDTFLALVTQKPGPMDLNYFLGGYLGLTLGFLAALLARTYGFAIFHVRAAKSLHETLLQRVLRLPMSFFWSQPVGRIMNRLAADTSTIDSLLGSSWLWLLATLARVVGILVLICLAIPVFAAILLPIFVIYGGIREFYRRSARELQRIEAISRSPVFAHLGETMVGGPVVRVYAKHTEWLREASARIQESSRSKFAVDICAIWLVLQLETLGGIVILLAAIVIVAYNKSIGPGLAGLALSYALNIVVNLSFSVRQASLVEQQMSAVERVLEFSDLPIEGDENELETEIAQVDESWPEQGKVTFQDVVVTYRDDLDPALRGVSFEIDAGTKVGIVGRTGSGKSTIMATLLRIVPTQRGTVLVDGLDVASLNVRLLRSRMAVVPQDPVMFRSTLRYNLDPFDEYDDAQVWQALRHAHADHIATRSEQGLLFPVADNGGNLSVGERGLVCLARALLKPAKIVLLDEASAALDARTDALIQSAIRERFKTATMLVVAHRLETIVDLDRILVMGDGRLVESGRPSELLGNPESSFRKLANETGELEELLAKATKASLQISARTLHQE